MPVPLTSFEIAAALAKEKLELLELPLSRVSKFDVTRKSIQAELVGVFKGRASLHVHLHIAG